MISILLLRSTRRHVTTAIFCLVVGTSFCAASCLRAQAPELSHGQDLGDALRSSVVSTEQPVSNEALPNEVLGPYDLVELRISNDVANSGRFRIGTDGQLILGGLNKPVRASGLTPPQLAEEIKRELVAEQLMVNPIVNVSAIEYRSRRVSVTGAVVHSVTFDVTGNVTLLDAITMAGGPIQNISDQVLFTSTVVDADGKTLEKTIAIPASDILSRVALTYNPVLHGGEKIRVTEASKIFIAGNVRHPGSFFMQPNRDTTVLKALALSEGTLDFSQKNAFIYRQTYSGSRQEIPVPLSRIIARKIPDMDLKADDVLYIPTSNAKRMTAKTLGVIVGFGSATASGALIYGR